MSNDRQKTSDNAQWPTLKADIPSKNEERPKTRPGADIRRRELILAKKRKREQVRRLMVEGISLAVVLFLVLAGAGIYALIRGNSHAEKDAAVRTGSAVQPSSDVPAAKDPVTEEPAPKVLEGRTLPLQIDIQNEPVTDLESLDTEFIDWGYGPARDESNRPLEAVEYQKTYGKYNAHFIVPTEEKIIYLTFDEGYENGYTTQILDTLKELDCPAVFFVLQTYVEENRGLVQRMIDEGHIVGNHSINHPDNGVPSESLEDQRNEVVQVHNYMLENYNYKMWLWRFPSGTFNQQSLAMVNNLNYQTLFWSFAYKDYDETYQINPADAVETALNELHPGAIYLFHAVTKTSADMLEDFIPAARKRGYQFALFTADPSLTITSLTAVAPEKESH